MMLRAYPLLIFPPPSRARVFHLTVLDNAFLAEERRELALVRSMATRKTHFPEVFLLISPYPRAHSKFQISLQ